MKLFYTCKNCEHEFELDVTPITPAQTYGPPENCYPEEGGEVEPEECPECNHKVDKSDAHKRANDKAVDDYEAYLEDKYDEIRDERRGGS